tara:strand:+ start:3417 stop:3620 length:204 start_codon:yes stop_codon:yes gene_type:complete
MELQDKNAFNESVAFAAGVSHEKSRLRKLIKTRLEVLKVLNKTPVRAEVVRNMSAELERLLDWIESD